MLENWLAPVPTKPFNKFKDYNKFQLGKRILIYTEVLPDISNIQIAILGVGADSANKVRRHLYASSYAFQGLRIADLGNARKDDRSFIIPVIKELLAGGILPIIIGDDVDTSLAQYQAYKTQKHPINMVLVDEKIRYKMSKQQTGYLDHIIDPKDSHLFHLGILAYQKHFTPSVLIGMMDKYAFEHQRLGAVRSEIEETEPVIRDADLFSFNIGAMRASEAPAQDKPSPSGLYTEEACQIARYAGISDKLTSFGIYGYQTEYDRQNLTAQVVAQLIWYFIEGFYARKNDYPVSLDGLMEYIVDFKEHDHQVTFWKSTKSGRWWMQIPLKAKKKLQRHKLIPCSYLDYQQACQEDFPDRLINAYKRFEH